jgi:adenylosuccinate synthase
MSVTVVLDSQAGSCGKGKFIGYLAGKDHMDIAIDNFMSNAGHTYVTEDGIKVMTQQLPTSLVNPNTSLVIGPEAAITPHILFDEMIKYKDMIGDRKIIINPNAVEIADKHRREEQRVLRSGSTFKGCGSARADKVMRQAMLFGEFWNKLTSENGGNFGDDEGDYGDLNYCITCGDLKYVKDHLQIMDTMQYINDAINDGKNIIVEGSQGCDLDINYGLPYPNTTSRQCHAGQLVADCGISPRLVDNIIMIMRPYPIRISNTTNLHDENGDVLKVSSGDYAGSQELTWDIIKERCGAPADIEFGEQTTVTKKTRRVFEMNWDRLKYVTILSRPTGIALNFVQYIDWNAYKCKSYDELPSSVRVFIEKVETETGVPVVLIGTGPNNDDIIDRR